LRSEELQKEIDRMETVLRAQHYSSEYISGMKMACNHLRDWLIQQGVIKGKLKVGENE